MANSRNEPPNRQIAKEDEDNAKGSEEFQDKHSYQS